MKGFRFIGLVLLLVALLALTACAPGITAVSAALPGSLGAQPGTTTPGSTPETSPGGAATPGAALGGTSAPAAATTAQPLATPTPGVAPSSGAALASVGDLQTALQQIYDSVNPSVVNIQVTEGQVVTGTGRIPRLPGIPNLPTPDQQNPHIPGGPIPLQAVGSGFVWDPQGHIVTNNHVVDGATNIRVTFADGAEVPATVVGTDPDSDLAVIKVDTTGLNLRPIVPGDSNKVRPGTFAVAIGNPFGLEGSMTFGIVSAMGRSLPAQAANQVSGPTFTIPNIIQTDAPINPGNSGGVLLDLQGQLIGVPTAIESAQQSNSGVGFAIPSAIVQNVVPALIQTGRVQHPYLGISGTTLGPDLAKAMGLPATQRGALVIDVTAGGPSEAAGLQPSTKTATINGIDRRVGGDVIVRIDNQPVTRFDDLPAYLALSTKVGQAVTLTVLRNGKETPVSVTLGNRPAQASRAAQATPPAGRATPQGSLQATPEAQATPQSGLGAQATPQAEGTPQSGLGGTAVPQATPQTTGGTPWLGVSVLELTPDIAGAMNLNASQTGVLVERVAANSPAEKAGLRGSSQTFTPNRGPAIQIGGDVITAVDGQNVATVQDLSNIIRSSDVGQKLTLSVLRDGATQSVSATLEARPAGQ